MPSFSRRRLAAPLAGCLLVVLGLAIGCTPEPTTGPDHHAALPTTSPSQVPSQVPAPGATVTPVDTQHSSGVSFQTQVAPLLSNSCAACHGSAGAGGVSLFDGSGAARYSSIKSRIGSIIDEVSSGQMPRNGTRFTQSEIQLLENWADAGAPNN